ncbi:MAG: multidrug ABC transporter ATP-binding protein, partial [Microcystis sp.]
MYSVSDDSKTMTNTSRQTVLETLNLQKTYRTGFWLNKKIESLKNCTLI